MGSGSRFSHLTPSLAQASRYVLWLSASGLSNPGHEPPRMGRYPQEKTVSSSWSTPVLCLFQALTTSSFSSTNTAMHTKSCFLLICYPMFWAFHSGDFSRHGRKQKNPCFCVSIFWSLTPRQTGTADHFSILNTRLSLISVTTFSFLVFPSLQERFHHLCTLLTKLETQESPTFPCPWHTAGAGITLSFNPTYLSHWSSISTGTASSAVGGRSAAAPQLCPHLQLFNPTVLRGRICCTPPSYQHLLSCRQWSQHSAWISGCQRMAAPCEQTGESQLLRRWMPLSPLTSLAMALVMVLDFTD